MLRAIWASVWDTVKDMEKRHLQRFFGKPKLQHLRLIAIDEFYLGRRANTLRWCWILESGAIVFVGEGKGAEALEPFWKRLRRNAAQIEAVAMDMSAAYTAAVAEHLRMRPSSSTIFMSSSCSMRSFRPAPRDVSGGDRQTPQGCTERDPLVAVSSPKTSITEG